MAFIAPSILAADFANLQQATDLIAASGGDLVHVDVMDGHFVPNISIGIPVVASLRRVTRLPLDVHLMIDRPGRYVEAFCKAGADYLTVHVEADTPEAIHAALDRTAALGVKPAISLKPGTPAEAVFPFLEKCAMVLVMTVEPGFGGQAFMEDMMPKLAALRDRLAQVNPACLLEVDGGIDRRTAPVCKAAGANVLVTGSAFFRAEDKPDFVRAIQK